MCGRYNIIPDVDAWLAAFELDTAAADKLDQLAANYNVTPGTTVPIVTFQPVEQHHTLTCAQWGLIPHWVKEARGAKPLINARSETVLDKPAFRQSMMNSRCLIPATGFYEWRPKQEGETAKQPYHFYHRNGGPLGFAGLLQKWQDPVAQTVVNTCAVLTTSANQAMAEIHQRMPVILNPADYRRWLTEDYGRSINLLKPCPNDWLTAEPISTHVNSPAHNDYRCVEPIQLD